MGGRKKERKEEEGGKERETEGKQVVRQETGIKR